MSASGRRILIVGAGFSGAVTARELADRGFHVDVIDRRDHIGGNAWDYENSHGIRIHKYGPHLFHTNNEKVFDWLSRFTEWVPYTHRVKAMLSDGRLVTFPANRETRDIVGEDRLYETFIRPYSQKMWGMPMESLDPKVIRRVPFRDDLNDCYFPNDRFQCLPRYGYSSLFRNMLDHGKIKISLGVSFTRDMEKEYIHVFNSMSIDEYYGYVHGALPYRSIRFHHVDLPLPRLFDVSTVNFTHDGPYTRLTEWKNLPCHGTNECFTTLTYEEPCDCRDNEMERYYPVLKADGSSRRLYEQYRRIRNEKVTFMGRLGQYAYLDMHQCISSSLAIAEDFIKNSS